MGKIELDHTGAGAGITLSSDGTDLLLDGTAIGGGASALTIDNKTGAYTVVADDLGKIINCTSGTFTVSLTAAATLGAGFNVTIWNTSATATHAITIDPNGSETIDGSSTLILRRGEGMQIVCDGNNWQTGDKKVMRAYAENSLSSATRPVASGDKSIAIGESCTASSTESVSLGAYALSTGAFSVAIGRSSATGTAAIAIGFEAAAANLGTAIGMNSASGGAKSVTSAGAMALGGSYASGTDSFAAAIANNTSSYGATGANSVAMGNLAKATGADSFAFGESSQATAADAVALGRSVRSTSSYAVAMGYNCLSSASYSVALGYSTTASGDNAFAAGASSTYLERATASGAGSVALGGAYASATDSVSIGASSTTGTTIGKIAFSNDKFSANGDSQHGLFILRSDTTDATPEALTSNNSAAGTTNQIILPNNSAYAFHGTIVAREQASAGTDCAAWKIEGLIRREGSAGTTVLVSSATTVLDNTPAWVMALSADTTNGGLKIEVTGAAATNIRWVATVHTSEVTYA